mgnify:CR=1 FL=1
MSDDRRMTTDRFFGGVDGRLDNLRTMLEYVGSETPTEVALWEWLRANTAAESDSTIRTYVGFIRSIGLLEREDDRYAVTECAREYVDTGDRRVLFEALTDHVKGFETILQALSRGYRSDEEIQAQLRAYYPGYTLPQAVVGRHLEWLEAIGVIEQHGDHYVPTAFGQEITRESVSGEWLDETASSGGEGTTDGARESEKDSERLSLLREKAEQDATSTVSTSVNTRGVTEYDRSDNVRAYVMERADGECEGCGEPAPFVNRDGDAYLHAHHVLELSAGGPDSPETVIALCPNCHYRVHHGQDWDAYNRELVHTLSAIEDVPVDEILSVE